MNPDDFIITRKRKKYRFAKFANSSLCFEFDEWLTFCKVTPCKITTVEIGAGTGLFSVELAATHPETQFMAVDVKADRLQKGALEAESRGLSNIRFLRARANQLLDLFPKKSVETIWLTFPDPFPRERSAKHRLTHPNFLKIFQALLSKDGAVYLKHDSSDFFRWSLEQFVKMKWNIEELNFDLHESDLPDGYKSMTTYEKRWTSEGAMISFVKATPPALDS